MTSSIKYTFTMASRIYANKGFGGLWAGVGIKSLHLGGSGALMAFFIPLYTKMLDRFY